MDFPHSNRYSTTRQQQIRRSLCLNIPAQGNERTALRQQQTNPVSAVEIMATIVFAAAATVFWLWANE